MKKLEDIPKKEIFTVPEGYFEKLPGVIQARVAAGSSKATVPVFQNAMRYALPVVVLITIGAFWFLHNAKPMDAESILAAVQTEDLVAYLDAADVSTEEMLESVGFSELDAEEIEGAVYTLTLDEQNLQNVIDELDTNNF